MVILTVFVKNRKLQNILFIYEDKQLLSAVCFFWWFSLGETIRCAVCTGQRWYVQCCNRDFFYVAVLLLFQAHIWLPFPPRLAAVYQRRARCYRAVTWLQCSLQCYVVPADSFQLWAFLCFFLFFAPPDTLDSAVCDVLDIEWGLWSVTPLYCTTSSSSTEAVKGVSHTFPSRIIQRPLPFPLLCVCVCECVMFFLFNFGGWKRQRVLKGGCIQDLSPRDEGPHYRKKCLFCLKLQWGDKSKQLMAVSQTVFSKLKKSQLEL